MLAPKKFAKSFFIIDLPDHEAHVWQSSLALPSSILKGFFSLLSKDEKQRSQRFLFESDRKRFIAAHGLLRTILSHYLNCPPEDIRFSQDDYGKPYLISKNTSQHLQFNISHSHELGLFAICRNQNIGVDIEYIRQNSAIDKITKRFFSMREHDEIEKLPTSEKIAAFFHVWAQKEAFLKAMGKGLYFPLNEAEVNTFLRQPAELISISGNRESAKQWSLFTLKADLHYAAAVAVKSSCTEIKYWYYSNPTS